MTTTAPTIVSIEPFGPSCGWPSSNIDDLTYWDRQYLNQLRDTKTAEGELYIIHYDDGTWADATSSELYVDDLAATIAPFVAAPTETGPWQRIEDVPEGVLQIKDRHGRTWLVVGGTWRFEWHDGNWYEPHTNINAQAPFLAADEEG